MADRVIEVNGEVDHSLAARLDEAVREVAGDMQTVEESDRVVAALVSLAAHYVLETYDRACFSIQIQNERTHPITGVKQKSAIVFEVIDLEQTKN